MVNDESRDGSHILRGVPEHKYEIMMPGSAHRLDISLVRQYQEGWELRGGGGGTVLD